MLTNKQILERLKNLYNQGLVSALVGAGFTKNMYKGAVNWWQLLKGVILDAYDLEVKQMYDQYKHQLSFFQRAKPLKDMEDDFVDVIIKRDGYLKIVSNYIKAKGCREAIDVYIEEHNPFFIATPKGITVSGDSSTILTENDLSTHRAFLECRWQQIFTTNYDNALEFTSNHYHLSHEVITKDYEMSRTRLNNSIVKIHGNLADQKKSLEVPFEFDNDKSLRYIISEEDYDTYPTRHQAFSYLLRIAMLSGAYCLIGFSGDDPNFLAWLDWVKDILDKDYNLSDKEEESIKVFLISVDKKPISKEKQLFYRNHHIAVVNLNDGDVQTELGVSSPTPDYPDLFKALFAYISKDSVIAQDPATSFDVNSLWSSIYSKVYHNKAEESYADELEQIRTYRSLKRYDKYYYYEQHVLEHILEKKTDLNDEQKLAALFALSDLCWPKKLISPEAINQLKDEPEWRAYSTFQDTLNGAEDSLIDKTDEAIFQNILRAFYHLNFKKAEILLKDWKPSEMWLCRKSSLNYYFDKDSTLNDLDKLSTTSRDLYVRYNAVVLHDYIDCNLRFNESRLQYKGLDGIPEMIFYHVNQLRLPKIRIERYGQQESTVSYKDAIVDPLEKSLRFFRFLTENGLNTTYSIFNVIGAEDWYFAFSNLMSYYPWACLYYSAHYNNNRVLTRIGQDYAYCAELKNVLPDILNRVLDALVEGSMPVFMRFGILQICSRFFIAVPEDQYYDKLKAYLKQVYFNEKGDAVYSKDAHRFVALALNSISSSEHIVDMLSILTDYYAINPNDASSLITGHLRWKKIGIIDDTIQEKIVTTLNSSDKSNSIYIALRLEENKLLSQKTLNSFLDRFIDDQERLKGVAMHPLACLCRLAKNSSKHLNSLKKEILQRSYWGSYKQNSFGGEEQFLRFSLLPKEMIFSIQENVTIATKLEEVFNGLYPQIGGNNQFFRFIYDDVLEEMDDYIEANPLSFSAEFKQLFNSAMNTYRGFASIEQSFYGDTSDYIDEGIKRVHKLVRKAKFDIIEPYLILALDRLLFKNTVANTELLDLVATIVWKFSKDVCNEATIVNKLFWLLQIYSHDDLRTYDFEVVDATYSFLLISKALKSQGLQDQYIDWWIEDENHNRFNYIEIE